LYLGHRRWAVSLDRPKSLVMSCLNQAGARKLLKAELPAIGIVEIPAGCAIQTDEWILQTSRITVFSARNDSALIPQLRGVNWALAAVNDSTKQTEKLKDSSLHAAVAVMGSHRRRSGESVKFQQDDPSVRRGG
jgi:hypothetical protein